MATKVTLKEIAQEVGLSPSAVSLVLNDRPCRISDENRRRIKEVAARKRYVPNQIARSLVMQQSRTLGLIVPNIMSRFFSSFARNLEVRCRERGYALFIMNSDGKTENDADLVRLLINRGVDGIFLVAAEEVSPDPLLMEQLEAGIVPVVMVDRSIENAPGDKVRFDSELGGYLATKHLLDEGHRRIACVVNTASHTGRDRLAGCRRAFAEAGAPFGEDLVFESDYYIADGCRAAERIVVLGAGGRIHPLGRGSCAGRTAVGIHRHYVRLVCAGQYADAYRNGVPAGRVRIRVPCRGHVPYRRPAQAAHIRSGRGHRRTVLHPCGGR